MRGYNHPASQPFPYKCQYGLHPIEDSQIKFTVDALYPLSEIYWVNGDSGKNLK